MVRGHHLERLPIAGGQFMNFRFLTRGLWWRAHPYSVSALPGGNEMRITVKAAGEHSFGAGSAHARARRVAIEGPYGAFTRYAPRHRQGVAGGRRRRRDAGEGHARRPAAARRRGRLVARLGRPATSCCATRSRSWSGVRGGRLHEIVGQRGPSSLSTPATWQRLVPDIAGRDLYVCGPSGF